MAPKKTIAEHLRARLSPARKDPEEGTSNEEEEFSPPLNQQGATNPVFDPVIGPPSGKEKLLASASSDPHFRQPYVTSRDDEVLERVAVQDEQLRQLFRIVSSLGSDVRSCIDIIGAKEIQRFDDATQSDPSQKGKGKAASRSVSFADLAEDDREVQDDDDDNNNDDDDDEIGEVDDYVSHLFYRERLAEGFDKRSPSRLAANKPAYFPIDDSVTRTLATSKYSAKAAEYSITVANAFFAAVTRAALDDAIAATKEGDTKSASILLAQVSNNMAAIEDLHRDRMLFLDLTSDPSASATEKDYANNILRNEFTPGVQNKGGSSKANKNFAAYQQQFLRATQFASAKATANRHLASSSGSGSSTTYEGRTPQAPNPSSNTQKKKAAAAAKKTTGERGGAAGAGQQKPKGKAQPEGDE